MTRAAFIGDNERKRWDASLPPPSPPRCSFISPSHQADSPLVTSAAATLKNRQQSVWDENLAASCGLRCRSALSRGRAAQGTLTGLTPAFRTRRARWRVPASAATDENTASKKTKRAAKIQFGMHFPTHATKKNIE